MNHEVKEVEKLKKFLIEIMLSPDWRDGLEDYKWYPNYKEHMTYAQFIHKRGYIKYGKFKSGRSYDFSIRGINWLDKQQGEHHGTNE